MDLSTEVVCRGSSTVLELGGDIDMQTAPILSDSVSGLVSQGATDIVINLGEVEFLDSSAMGALVDAQRALAAVGGSLKIAAPRPHVAKIFAITRLTAVIAVFPTVEAACD